MLCRKTSPWQHNLNQKASGKPGAVQLVALNRTRDNPLKTSSYDERAVN